MTSSHTVEGTSPEFVVHSLPMISARVDAEARVFKRIDCARGVWLIAQQPNEGDNVYFHDPKDIHSDGFGGATLEFPLVDGSVYKAKGPWKSGPDKLFSDTGYDAREKHLTFVVIGREVEFRKNPKSYMGSNRVIKDVIYRDPEGGKIGNFNRYMQILADLPDGDYYYYTESPGGSAAGKETVDEWWRNEIKRGEFYPRRPK